MLTLKLSKTPRFKKMYRRGYVFEKKTRNILQTILDKFKTLKYYVIESRGSRGKADIIVGFYNTSNGERNWVGIQCKKGYVSQAEQKRQIQSAMKDNGMIMFFALSTEERSSSVKFYPEFVEYIKTWTNT
tara:strand:+ start:929 stop:1318 length:390 start_codon:yes stop_codon:yes gene_type:complete